MRLTSGALQTGAVAVRAKEGRGGWTLDGRVMPLTVPVAWASGDKVCLPASVEDASKGVAKLTYDVEGVRPVLLGWSRLHVLVAVVRRKAEVCPAGAHEVVTEVGSHGQAALDCHSFVEVGAVRVARGA